MVDTSRQVNGKPVSYCNIGYCQVGIDDNLQLCLNNGSCWVGLIINSNKEISWSDGTDIDFQLIDESLCNHLNVSTINETKNG